MTRIEALIALAVLALLSSCLVPNLSEGKVSALQAMDQANLRWHFIELSKVYDRNMLPKQGGHKFVLSSWFRGIVEKCEVNFDRYWSPAVAGDARRSALAQQDLETIWRDEASVRSVDTHYAGRSHQYYKGMHSGQEAWMSNDEEAGRTFPDGRIHVLMGDGCVRVLLPDPDLNQYGFDGEGHEPFAVGSLSPHPWLQKLAR